MFETYYYYPAVCAAIFTISYAGVRAFRRWSERRGLFDIPNERSSHAAPTPRGGGAVIVAVCLAAYAIYTLGAAPAGTFSWGYLAGALLVAAVSWLDDLYSVSFLWRLLIHALAAGLFVASNGSFELTVIPQTRFVEIGAAVTTVFWIVWLTNAYNFMDGIDGIAGAQTVTAGLGWLIAGFWLDLPVQGFYGGVLACAGLGFLIENWQPAKIFMGDVGSAFLGYTFSVLPLLSIQEAANVETRTLLPVLALAFNWWFVFDTVYTMSRRAFRREKIWEAHRTHIYQRLVIAGYQHQTVTLLYGGLSAIIISAAIFWTVARGIWEMCLLVTIIAVQTVGLLFYLRIMPVGGERKL